MKMQIKAYLLSLAIHASVLPIVFAVNPSIPDNKAIVIDFTINEPSHQAENPPPLPENLVEKKDTALQPMRPFERPKVARSDVEVVPTRLIERTEAVEPENLSQTHKSETSPVKVTERTQVADLKTSSERSDVEVTLTRLAERSKVATLKTSLVEPKAVGRSGTPAKRSRMVFEQGIIPHKTYIAEAKDRPVLGMNQINQRDSFEQRVTVIEKNSPIPSMDAEEFTPQSYELQAKTDARGSPEGDFPAQAGTVEDPERARLRFNAMVLGKIEKAKVYPAMARERGMEGEVSVSFTIFHNGRVENIEVLPHTSCHELLKKAAVTTIEKAAPYLPVPVGLMRNGEGLRLKVKIFYKLN